MTAIYINPTQGNDKAVGSQTAPLKTVSAALRRVKAPATLQLARGNYTSASGETFPLRIPAGIIVIGHEASRGQGIVLRGGGKYQSATFKQQNATAVLEGNAQLRGVTVTNPEAKGTGIWVESANGAIARNTITNCQREGIFITGNSKPLVRDNILRQNAASGIFLVRNAKGEIKRNLCEQTGYGIAVSDDSAPLISDNRLLNNRVGIHLTRHARPVLRRNSLENNSQGGLIVKDDAQPDLGGAQDPAGNIFQNNRPDVDNQTALNLVSAGNRLNPAQVKGTIDFMATVVSESAIGPVRFSDIEGHWAETFIDRLGQRGLIGGFPDGTFKPQASLTRAQYAALIAKSFDLPRQLGRKTRFGDIAANFWGAKAIEKAAAMGFISGFGDGTFRPQQNLTRVQALVSLVSGLGLTGGPQDLLLKYRDRAQIPPYATNAIATATQKRLVVNYPDSDRLEPLRDISRAEIAALLYQALAATAKVRTILSPYIVSPDALLPSFTDVRGHWAADFIRRLGSLELISGFPDGSFKPDKTINRAEYAALLVKVFNPAPVRPATHFIDVPDRFWGLSAIQQAYRAGFLSGFPDRTFHPEQTLRRLHLVVSLASGLSLPEADLGILSVYEDRETIPAYARPAVAAATQSQIVASYPKPRDLNQGATRAEAAAMMYQALVYKGLASKIPSPYIVTP